jgi:hypothetical protein
VQVLPSAWHPHFPFVHVPLQQSLDFWQVWLLPVQAHLPETHDFEQHCASFAHVAPVLRQAHLPLVQTVVQH